MWNWWGTDVKQCWQWSPLVNDGWWPRMGNNHQQSLTIAQPCNPSFAPSKSTQKLLVLSWNMFDCVTPCSLAWIPVQIVQEKEGTPCDWTIPSTSLMKTHQAFSVWFTIHDDSKSWNWFLVRTTTAGWCLAKYGQDVPTYNAYEWRSLAIWNERSCCDWPAARRLSYSSTVPG